MAKKYFIDGGGNKGQSARIATKLYPDHQIHTFECGAGFFEEFYEDLSVVFHKEAIWIKDGLVDFYPANQSEGSTLIKGKLTAYVDYKNPIKVPCIDFSKWLKENFTKEDDVVLKLNIEGAEMEVLNKMIADRTIELIDDLYVDFHARKISSIFYEDEKKLKRKLYDLGFNVKKWYVPRNQNYYLNNKKVC